MITATLTMLSLGKSGIYIIHTVERLLIYIFDIMVCGWGKRKKKEKMKKVSLQALCPTLKIKNTVDF